MNSTIRDMLILAIAGLMVVWGLNNRPKIYAALGVNIPTQDGSTLASGTGEVDVPQRTVQTPRSSGSVATIQKSPNGQFETQAYVNSSPIHFLIDTGASLVALTYEDAQRIGIKDRNLKFNVRIQTAAGDTFGARVKLDVVRVGAVSLNNVDAVVLKDGLHKSLLGMTFLGEIQNFQVNRDYMTLRL